VVPRILEEALNLDEQLAEKRAFHLWLEGKIFPAESSFNVGSA
jgi:hypothetical protein